MLGIKPQGIVLHFSKTVYWPIPKNACTMIKAHLMRFLQIVTEDGDPHHANFEWTKKSVPGYRDWALVRHPLHRLHSLWINKIAIGHPESPHFVKGMDTHVFPKKFGGIVSGMPFNDFVAVVLQPNEYINAHWAPQNQQIPNGCDCQKMEELGWFSHALFPTPNVSHLNDPWQTAYTSEMKSLATKYYKEDFERFGYDR